MTLLVPAERAAVAPVTTPAERRRRAHDALRGVAGFVVVLVAWEVLARTVLRDSRTIAPPTAVVDAIVDHWSLYQRAARATLWEAAQGFLWGNLGAIALATIAAAAPFTERVVLRVALVVFCLPLVALGPLLRVVYGPGDGPQVTLAALAVFYTTLVPLLVGLRAVPQTWTDLVASYGRGRLRTLLTVRARAAVPYLFTGLQVAAPAAFLGALVGEFTGAEHGMGLLTINSMRALRTSELWAVASISALISMAAYLIVGAIGRRLATGRPALLLVAPPTAAPRSAWRRLLRWAVEMVATLALVWVLWVGLMGWFDLDPYFAKRPGDVWQYLVSGSNAAVQRQEIVDALLETARVALPGYVLGLLVGAVVAAVFALSDVVRRTATPFAVALRCVPVVAIAPLLTQAFGRGVAGTTTTVAVLTFFPTLVACTEGLKQAPRAVLDVYAVYDTGRVRTLLSGQVPAMVPAFFAAARIAVPATVLAATVAEWLSTGTGVGNLMSLAAANSRYATLWSCVVLVTLLAAVGYGSVTMVERAVLARVAPEQLRT